MNENDTADTVTPGPSPSPCPTTTDTSGGFGALARKIRSRTTDLLAVAIVVVGGVTIGSQFASWWATDENDLAPQLAANTNLNWGTGETPVTLEFGDRPFQLERQTVHGDRDTAFARLVEICTRVAQQTQSVETELLPAEQKLLGLLQRQTPLREQPGVWRIYRIERPMTLIIATRTMKRPAESSGIGNDASDSKPQPDQPNRRVVCWGMAQPNRKDVWVLFTMRPTVPSAEPRPETGQVELPDGARKILSLRDASGGALTAFEGEADAEDWKSWFNAWFARCGWKTSQSWTESPVGWSAAFVPAEDDVTGRIDVSFSQVGESRLSGLISVTATVGVVQTGVSQEGFH
jgi:hypothetical protein